jgi:hypothetical protein
VNWLNTQVTELTAPWGYKERTTSILCGQTAFSKTLLRFSQSSDIPGFLEGTEEA